MSTNVPVPHKLQEEALEALRATRAAGNAAGLVVLATGLGKTWLAAFDSADERFARVLFVAHRDEILSQAMATFRCIRPTATLGCYTGSEKVGDAEVVFASIQTLGRQNHLHQFERNRFDYVVVDEFHHAAADSYRRLIEYFQPAFMLGLTATPDRMDGADLLSLCDENLVFRRDIVDGIRSGLLCAFQYFGVPDSVDYSNIPWRSRRFDPEALTEAVATQARAENALGQYRQRAGSRTLAFCCSRVHADFMADYFTKAGLRAVAVHSGENSAPRAESLRDLSAGNLDVIFAVDMFNEGVDLPLIDTVMMLRPTESSIVWLQQLGRGLRQAEGKPHLTVIDYIGNHRTFLVKPRTLFDAMLGTGATDREIAAALKQVETQEAELPVGCSMTYELQAIDLLRSLLRFTQDRDAVREYYEEFRERNDRRPTAVEVFHAGYNPRTVRKKYGSWFKFVEVMGDLSSDGAQILKEGGNFLDALEITPLPTCLKIIVLRVLFSEGQLPGEMDIDRVAAGVRALAARSALVREEISQTLSEADSFRNLVERGPVDAWCQSTGTGGGFFGKRDGSFHSLFTVSPQFKEQFQELAREIIDWRMAEYVQRHELALHAGGIVCRVIQTNGRPILKLPDRKNVAEIPTGWQDVEVDGERYHANFVKMYVNVVRPEGVDKNALPDIMRGWFGERVGLPGTKFDVAFLRAGDGYLLMPATREPIER